MQRRWISSGINSRWDYYGKFQLWMRKTIFLIFSQLPSDATWDMFSLRWATYLFRQNYIRGPLSYLFVTLWSFIFLFFRLGPLSFIKAHMSPFSHILGKITLKLSFYSFWILLITLFYKIFFNMLIWFLNLFIFIKKYFIK